MLKYLMARVLSLLYALVNGGSARTPSHRKYILCPSELVNNVVIVPIYRIDIWDDTIDLK